jgi:hypothetical protein
MSQPLQRLVAVMCYLGALRVPLVAFVLPGWALTIPSGLIVAGAAWAYGRKRSPFLLHHGREGFRWAIQANLLLAALSLLSMGLHYGWQHWDIALLGSLWQLGATLFRWAGLLVSIMTLLVMLKAARGQTGDAFTFHRTGPDA